MRPHCQVSTWRTSHLKRTPFSMWRTSVVWLWRPPSRRRTTLAVGCLNSPCNRTSPEKPGPWKAGGHARKNSIGAEGTLRPGFLFKTPRGPPSPMRDPLRGPPPKMGPSGAFPKKLPFCNETHTLASGPLWPWGGGASDFEVGPPPLIRYPGFRFSPHHGQGAVRSPADRQAGQGDT